jgi:transcriptional regulator with XRE-family HTH domain
MLKPRVMRAARALAGWEQSDLANASGISIATVRKIEQGAIGTRPSTAARIIAAFERAGLQLIPEGPDGGAGVRWKEREMNEELREFYALNNKIKGWFIYNLGREDNEELDAMIKELSSDLLDPGNQANWEGVLARWGLSKLPTSLVTDLIKLGEMEDYIVTEQWTAKEAHQRMATEAWEERRTRGSRILNLTRSR